MKEFLGKIKKFFVNIGKKIAEFFHRILRKIAKNKLYVLVIMQLKDKWNFSFKTNKKATFFKLIGYLIIFGAITAMVYLVMNISASKLAIFVTSKIPLNAMFPILLIVTIFEAVSILFGLTNALFFAKDNVVLITYAVKSDYLFLSKVIVYYIDAIKKSFTLLLPIFLSFGIIYSFPFYYYIFVIVMDLIYVGFIVLLCSIVAIPTYYILRFLNKYQIIKVLFSVVVLGLVVWGAIKVISVIPGNINLIREYEKFSKSLTHFLYWFENHFFMTISVGHMFFGVQNGMLMKCMSNYSWIVSLILIALVIGLVFVNKYLSKPFYNKMIATSNQSKTKKLIERKNHNLPKWLSVLHYEFARIIRDQKLLVSSIICIVSMPLIAMIVNRFYGAFKTRPIGDVLILVFNYFFIMLVVVSHNTSSSYIYSKDGPSWSVNKTMPVDPRLSLTLRLVYNFVVSLIIIIPSSLIFFGSAHAKNFSAILFILTLIATGTLHSVFSASYDFSNSPNKDKADIGSEIVTAHSTVSLAVGIIIATVVAAFTVILTLKVSSNPQLRLLILSTVLLVIEIFYFIRKIHLTFQEN